MQTQAHSSITTNRLRQARERRELSVADLARLANVPEETVAAIERAQYTPSLHIAVRLARALNSPVERLFWLPADDPRAAQPAPVRAFEARERERTATTRTAYIAFLTTIAALIAVTPFGPSLAPVKVVVYAMLAALIALALVVAHRHGLLSSVSRARWAVFLAGFFAVAATSASGDLGGNGLLSFLLAALIGGLTVVALVREGFIPTPLPAPAQTRLDDFVKNATNRVTSPADGAILRSSDRDILHNLRAEVARWTARVRQQPRRETAGGA